MFRLLATKPVSEFPTVLPAIQNDLLPRAMDDMERVEHYLAHTQLYINKRNPLVLLLEVLAPNINLGAMDYYGHVVSKLNEVSRVINGTSVERQGTMNSTSMFYGNGFKECRLITIKDYSVLELEEMDWFSRPALTILDHPITELSIPTFVNDETWDETGDVVVDISLLDLAFQFRAWARSFQHLDPHLRPDKERFIQHILYKDAIKSHMRIAWLNRMKGYMDGSPLKDFRKLAPIMTIDYTSTVDRYLAKIIETFYSRKLRYEEMLYMFVTPFGDGWDIMALPSESRMQQVHWAINLQRIKMFEVLAEFGYKRTINSDLATHLRRSYKATESLKTMREGLGIHGESQYLERFRKNIIDKL